MGFIRVHEGAMMIAIRPVFRDAGNRQIIGYLLMGRYLDDREVYRLSTMAQLPIELFSNEPDSVPADIAKVIPGFEQSAKPFLERGEDETILLHAPTITTPVDEKTLRTYSLLRDIYGKPVLVLRISIDRDIYAQGTSTTLYFVVMLIAAGIVFGLVTILLLEKTVLSRLARLSSRVNDIGRKRDFSARVEIRGADEIGGLAGNVNGMLEDLEESQNVLHNRLIQSEEHYRLLFNSITDPVCVCRMGRGNLPEKIIEVNDAACEVLGYLRTDFMAMELSDLLMGSTSGGVDLPAEVLRSFGHVIYAGTCRTKSGHLIPVEINARTFDQFGRPAFVAIIRDVSEREEVERLKREAFDQIEKNIQQFAILNDHIRNPLQGMMGIADLIDDPEAKKIIKYGRMIDDIVKKIDLGYYESEKIYKVLRKYYDIGRK
jgi:PAS domain S-box-containing protein